jgi:hypothetical protein
MWWDCNVKHLRGRKSSRKPRHFDTCSRQSRNAAVGRGGYRPTVRTDRALTTKITVRPGRGEVADQVVIRWRGLTWLGRTLQPRKLLIRHASRVIEQVKRPGGCQLTAPCCTMLQEVMAMQIKDCGCPGRPEEKPAALSNAILTYCCPQRGWGVASVSDCLRSIMPQVEKLRADLCEVLRDVLPPGKATVMTCWERDGPGYCQRGDTGIVLCRGLS